MDEGDFGWALAKMRDGYKVRRREWRAGRCIWISTESTPGVLVGDLGQDVKGISLDSLLAQDWELHLD